MADFISKPAEEDDIKSFVKKHGEYIGRLEIAGIEPALKISRQQVEAIAAKYLFAVKQAGRICRHIVSAKGPDNNSPAGLTKALITSVMLRHSPETSSRTWRLSGLQLGEFGLPENLKLSIHSGSDKFSIYGPINKALRKFDAGLHLKTAGC